MRMNFLIIGLVTLLAVIGLVMSRDPERAAAISQMYRDSELSADTKQILLLALALAIGGFIAYFSISRR